MPAARSDLAGRREPATLRPREVVPRRTLPSPGPGLACCGHLRAVALGQLLAVPLADLSEAAANVGTAMGSLVHHSDHAAAALLDHVAAAPGPDGSSNSRSEDKKCPRWHRRGVDTISLLWSEQGGTELLSRLVAEEHVPYARGLLSLRRGQTGARVMAWPEYGVVKLECRLAALVDGTRESHRLGTVAELADCETYAVGELQDLFGAGPHAVSSTPGVGRVDLVTERDCQAAEGVALLRAMRSLCPPGMKLVTHIAADGRVETVAAVTERGHRTVFRAYDKGVESGSCAPGELIRFEAQRQLSKRSRQTPGRLAESDLAAAFGRTIEPFVKGDPVTVTAPSGVVDQLAEKLAGGELTAARAERLVGAAELLRRYGRGIYASDHQSARRLRALREAGIAVDDELPPDVAVPVSELLAAALEEWSQ